MRIKGSKTLGRLARSSATASLSKKPIIWKVLIFAAGTDTVNGEYVWDGKTLINGKPLYKQTQGAYPLPETIQWQIINNKGAWVLYDYVGMKYASSDLITWTEETNVPFGLISPAAGAGNAPGPKAAFAYHPSGSVVGFIIGTAGTAGIAGTYRKTSTSDVFNKITSPAPLYPYFGLQFSLWTVFDAFGSSIYINPNVPDPVYQINTNMFRDYNANAEGGGLAPAPVFSQVFYY